MPKRRRERDRPKATQNVPCHNPNKRVLLSYGSDDEGDLELDGTIQTPSAGGRAVMPDAQLVDYHIDEYPDDYPDGELSAVMDSNNGEEAEEESSKHHREHADGQQSEVLRSYRTSQMPTLGVKSPQGNNSYEDSEEGYDSTTEEAMAYLKAVRVERKNIPDILFAPRPQPLHADAHMSSRDEDGSVDQDQDNVRTVPDESFVGPLASMPVNEDDPSDPQIAFTKKVIDRFLAHRELLRLQPSQEALSALGDKYPISFPLGDNKAYSQWYRLISSRAPQTAHLQSLQQRTVLGLLALIKKHFLVTGKNIKKETSSWIWSLLARLNDVGNMTNDEVFTVRELCQKAALVQFLFANPDIADEIDADPTVDADPDAAAAATAAAAANLHSPGQPNTDENDQAGVGTTKEPAASSPVSQQFHQARGLPGKLVTENTSASLEMMLVVVGHIFRQRDLLELRQPWQACELPE